VINLSLGNTYGPHNGSALLERFLDNASEIGRTVICIGSGNEGDSGGHVFGNVTDRSVVEWTIGEYERNLSLQIWKNYSDEYEILLRSPGNREERISGRIESGKYEVIMERTRVLVYVGEPTPYSADQEIYFEFLPVEGVNYLNSGIWQVQFNPIKVVTGEYTMYLPPREARNSTTSFLRPTPEATFTIPSTASKAITVGAYDSTFQSYADFSGRGYGEEDVITRFAKEYGKPDLVAPGVKILAPSIYGGLGAFTGTSFAAPIVSGAAALLMEWGIVRGNDPYLYGEKVKAYLIKGAKPLPGFTFYPNAKVGWGKLCLKDSFPDQI
jgi:subtilisin family serine protease